MNETNRLTLRDWTLNEKDLAYAKEIWGDSEVMRHISDEGLGLTDEKINSLIQSFIDHKEAQTVQPWALEIKNSGEVIGCCGFLLVRGTRSVYELTTHIKKSHWQKGYAREALQMAIELLLKMKTVTKITASTFPKNDAAKKLLESFGFNFKEMKYLSKSRRVEAIYEFTPDLSLLPRKEPLENFVQHQPRVEPTPPSPEITHITAKTTITSHTNGPTISETEITATKEVFVEHKDQVVLFFDGFCGLCNGFVDFLLPKNQRQLLKFATLQGDYSKTQLDSSLRESLDTVVLKVNDKIYLKSSAALVSLKYIGGIWGALALFLIIPKPIRDFFYDLIARNRYQWFGKKESCRIPTENEKAQFIN